MLHPETKKKLRGLEPLPARLWLASPTMHGPELDYVRRAYETNWMTTLGENVDELERLVCEATGAPHAVALASGTAAIHLALRLAARRAHGADMSGGQALAGREVVCQSLTFSATANPIAYEGGRPVFADSERRTWNLDPAAVARALDLHPGAKIVIAVHLYGTPALVPGLREVCDARGALLVEDAAEALGAACAGAPVGLLGDYGVVSFNGNKVVTGSSGGALLCRDAQDAALARKWSTQSREPAPWYQHGQLGYNYRMSNVVAGVARGQMGYLAEHVARKRAIFERYRAGLAGLPVTLGAPGMPGDEPSRWLSCLTVDEGAMCKQVRGDLEASYEPEGGKSCPTEVLEALASLNAEGRPVWKPLHAQPAFAGSPLVTASGEEVATHSRETVGARLSAPSGPRAASVADDLFARGVCLPSDIKMDDAQQDLVIECVRRCFGR